jgi:hypothetical protein
MTGCTGPSAYRYVGRVLIPPGVRNAEISERRVSLPVTASCPSETEAVTLVPDRRAVRVTVKPAELRAQPAGWLEHWAESLAQRGCIAPEDSSVLAAQVAETVPLEPRIALSLLHPPERDYVDLDAGSRLKAVGPLFREGTNSGALAIESVVSNGGTLSAKTSVDLVGIETAWYAVEAVGVGPGARIVFKSAEDHVGDRVTHPEHPSLDYLHFSPDAKYYRLFTITRLSQSNHDTLVLASPSLPILERETRRLEVDPSQCAALASLGACVEVPHDAALTKVPVVTANRAALAVEGRGTVRDALLAAGVKQPESVLGTLHIRRRYLRRLTDVEFDRADSSVLDFPLSGGEVLDW